MCSVRPISSSTAPFRISSRLTERAKALSFSFFLTDLTSNPLIFLSGRTKLTAVIKPDSSSQAKRTLSTSDSRGHLVQEA